MRAESWRLSVKRTLSNLKLIDLGWICGLFCRSWKIPSRPFNCFFLPPFLLSFLCPAAITCMLDHLALPTSFRCPSQAFCFLSLCFSLAIFLLTIFEVPDHLFHQVCSSIKPAEWIFNSNAFFFISVLPRNRFIHFAFFCVHCTSIQTCRLPFL